MKLILIAHMFIPYPGSYILILIGLLSYLIAQIRVQHIAPLQSQVVGGLGLK